MTKVLILKVDVIGTMKEIEINNNSLSLKTCISNESKNMTLVYWWLLDDYKYEAYGNIEQDDNKAENNHKLPINGSSELLQESSNNMSLYGTIFIIKYNINNKMVDISIPDYGEFYNIISLEDQFDSESDDIIDNLSDTCEELFYENLENNDIYVYDNQLELDIDENLYLKI